ncbi:MAG: CpsD/CapB family tyrosine-protein kinase [candidate division Zixibacteria bacterium]|nr:CpsD/CapB family tyrosine-protein kinase [candidate division Zixibacteria bacterium]
MKRIASNLVTHFEPKSPISEAYRTFRTNLQFARLDSPLRTILVTSSGPGEGKSTTVANLAITMAQMGTKTLLIDSDLRRPVLHSIFSLQRNPGLTNYLAGNVPLVEIIQSTPIENLSLLTCGVLPPNPSELLGSKKMKMLLEELKEKYEMILFDSPPVIAVTDAAVLSTLLDGVVLIASSGHTSREALVRATTLLQNVNGRLIGGVLNKIKVESVYGSYNYYYYYHYYGGAKQKRKKRTGEEVKVS